MSPEARRNRTRILIAFAAVYFIWGSTYLFIKYAIETIPPFMMGATRLVAAGIVLYAIARARSALPPTRRDWITAAITGFLMLGVGNGAVIWAQQTVPSGVVALIVSSVPIMVVLIDWLRPRGVRPRTPVFFGLALGLIGIIILIGPKAIVGQGHVDEMGAAVLLAGSLAWAFGSVITRGTARAASPLVYAGMQMLTAGAAMAIAAIVVREPSTFSFADISLRSALSWVYLVIGGSVIGYTAYIYLLGAVSAAKAATYAYVNPIIAVVLGWAFANEPIGVRTIVAAGVILASVALITSMQGSGGHATGEHPVSSKPSERKRSAA